MDQTGKQDKPQLMMVKIQKVIIPMHRTRFNQYKLFNNMNTQKNCCDISCHITKHFVNKKVNFYLKPLRYTKQGNIAEEAVTSNSKQNTKFL